MPTPSQLAKSGTEHGEQTALFAWCAMATMRGFDAADDERCYTVKGYAEQTYGTSKAVFPLKFFHAIPNGGTRGDDAKSRAIRGGQLKAEGVKTGVFDTFWPRSTMRYAGLYIEMKKPSLQSAKNPCAGMSEDQEEFAQYAWSAGYCVHLCYTWRQAADVIRAYWEGTV